MGGTKKYLCSAPHPSTWEDRAASLLKSLGGDARKREQLLKQTLSSLTEVINESKKSGPGRKSNAEHAINFYEYVLELNDTTTTTRITSHDDDDGDAAAADADSDHKNDNDKNDDVASMSVSHRRRQRLESKSSSSPSSNNDDDDDDGNEDDNENDDNNVDDNNDDEDEDDDGNEDDSSSSSSSSMATQEFLDQHNDLCEVCNEGGDLLCCSTCNLVFHLQCTRPKLTRVPTNDNWSCSYCIASGLTGHKRDARIRKRAASAVRLLNRLRNENKRISASASGTSGTTKDHTSSDHNNSNNNADATAAAAKDTTEENAEDHDMENAEEENGEDTAEENAEDSDMNNLNGSHEEGEEEKSEMEDQKEDRCEEEEGEEDREKDKEMELEETENKMEEDETVEKKEEEESNIEQQQEEKKEHVKNENYGKHTLGDESGESEEKRERRCRRQPILYDPQDCPASEWQSDGVFEWKHLSESEKGKVETSEDDAIAEETGIMSENEKGSTKKEHVSPKKKNKKRTTPNASDDEEQERDEPIWCNFCDDDPSIPICCFCACRVCFGKHDQSKLLLCDNCDDEYHTFCLTPPLTSIPSSKKWFCPTCRASRAGPKSEKTHRVPHKAPLFVERRPSSGDKRPSSSEMRPSSSEKRRGPGRPPNSERLPSIGKGATIVDRKRSATLKSPGESPISKRPRGRPPSTSREGSYAGKPLSSSSAKVEVGKRPRGRPPFKKSVAGRGSSVVRSDANVVRGPGRPRKSDSSSDHSNRGLSVKSRSRSPGDGSKEVRASPRMTKSGAASVEEVGESKEEQPEEVTSADNDAPSLPLAPIQRSRSGRMVKRSTFHDEIQEGEQHLRTRGLIGVSGPVGQATIPKSAAPEIVPVAAVEEVVTKLSKPETPPSPPITIAVAQPPTKTETVAVAEVSVRAPTPPVPVPPVPPVPPKIEAPPVAPKPIPVKAEVVQHVPTSPPPPPPVPTPPVVKAPPPAPTVPAPPAVNPSVKADSNKVPRRKPGARECMQISRRFGAQVISQKYMNTLLDYCSRGKVEHLIRMRERLDDHSRYLEAQLAGLEALVKEKGEVDVVVPAINPDEQRALRMAPPPVQAPPPPVPPPNSKPKVPPTAHVPTAGAKIPSRPLIMAMPKPVAPVVTVPPIQVSTAVAPPKKPAEIDESASKATTPSTIPVSTTPSSNTVKSVKSSQNNNVEKSS